MALDDAIELGKIKRGDLVVMIGSGVGYNMAAAAFRMTFDTAAIGPRSRSPGCSARPLRTAPGSNSK